MELQHDRGFFSWWTLLSSSTFPSPLTILTSPMFEQDDEAEELYDSVRWGGEGEEKGEGPGLKIGVEDGKHLQKQQPRPAQPRPAIVIDDGREAESKDEGVVGLPPPIKLTKRGKPMKMVGFSATDRIVLIPARSDYDEETKGLLWWSLTDYEAFKQATLADYQVCLVVVSRHWVVVSQGRWIFS
jgi:hypothetical protein